MHSYHVAGLTSLSWESLIRRHIEEGEPLKHLAAQAGISLLKAHKWLARFRAGLAPSLADRRSVRRTQRRTLNPRQLQRAEGDDLRIVTEVDEVPVWQLPLPAGEQLELVLVPVPAEECLIGTPKREAGRDNYMQLFQKCERVDVEALRPVRLRQFSLVRQPINQGQWPAMVDAVAAGGRELEAAPVKSTPESPWERHGQPGDLAVDSVSWNDSKEWLQRLNRWLKENW